MGGCAYLPHCPATLAVFGQSGCVKRRGRRPLVVLAVASTVLGTACADDGTAPLRAQFRWDMNNGESSGTACSFETTYFHDQSTGDPASWRWDLPDGSVSTEQNPVIATPEAAPGVGFSSVTLTVRRGSDEDSTTEQFVPSHC